MYKQIKLLFVFFIFATFGIIFFGCSSNSKMLIERPSYRLLKDSQSILVGSRLDGAYMYISRISDIRAADPEDFGRSEEVILALSGDSVSGTLLNITKTYFRNIGFMVSAKEQTSKNSCAFSLSLTIERFWVLAEPLTSEGVAEEYRYFITLRASMKDSAGKYVFKNKKFSISKTVSRSDIDPFDGEPPTSSYLLKLHSNAIKQIFTVHYIDILSQLWDEIRTKASCPNVIDESLIPPPYL